MTLAVGTRLGPYEVLGPLGAGGMGEVYRAKDSRLQREVAIKVLPGHLAQDRKALARFEREAKAVAALSHPYRHVAPSSSLKTRPNVVAKMISLGLSAGKRTDCALGKAPSPRAG